jgi:hypothetical protein
MKDERREPDAPPARPAEEEPREPPARRPTEPAPGVKHRPEPDAENIVPIKHEPGTL